MKLSVRYFASLREALGAGEQVELNDGETIGDLRDMLIARGGAHADALRRDRLVRAAIDRAVCDETAVPGDAAEVAFFPPVTGG